MNGEPFLIAPLSEAALERREKLYAGLYLALGLLGVAVPAWAIRHTGLRHRFGAVTAPSPWPPVGFAWRPTPAATVRGATAGKLCGGGGADIRALAYRLP